ncbi:hypothetical protein PIB30_083457 [Stylosanthes scabra]|uniref:Secreted protein n=1 Tax=Stylosanthes scabra TaxID=79078 RepID=A0ABU6ZQY2_9FABA|nr:hypothetical protein [Stylosanthes scabra]
MGGFLGSHGELFLFNLNRLIVVLLLFSYLELPTSARSGRSLRIVSRLPSRAYIMLKLTSRHVLNEPERPLLASWVYLGPRLRIGPVVIWAASCRSHTRRLSSSSTFLVSQVDFIPLSNFAN